MKFQPGNKIKYRQDFRGWIGIQPGIEFEIIEVNDRRAKLVAPGYGGEPYGNGCILIYRSDNERVGVTK